MRAAMRRRLLLSAASAAFAVPMLRRAAAAPRHATLQRRHVVGYQGWFVCPDDPGSDGWVHWFARTREGRLNPTFDMLPDTKEFEEGEGCPTPWTDRIGRPVRLFSAQDARTVRRHFRWMREYEIDCAASQRFVTSIRSPRRKAQRDRVLAHVRAAAEAEDRGFFVMYDASGQDDAGLAHMVNDWRSLVADGLLTSPAYQWHGGRPVLAVWGLGFRGRPLTPPAVRAALDEMRGLSGPQGLTIMAGVPAYWRRGDRDADSFAAWNQVYSAVDIISPWTVGRYTDNAGVDRYLTETLRGDLSALRERNKEMMPVIFPGFSWANLRQARAQTARLNQIARRCGDFYWHQAANAVNAGATMLYTAMFDEVDEATAIFKLAPTQDFQPDGQAFVSLDADGCALPSDWYLRLASGITAGLRAGGLPARPPI